VIERAVVAQEKHQDGQHHLHLLIQLEKRQKFSGSAGLKRLQGLVRSQLLPEGKQGNFQMARNIRAVLKYVIKEDDQYLSFGIDVPQVLSKKSSNVTREVVDLLQQGSTLEEINQVHPSYVLLHKRKLEDYISWQASVRMKAMQAPQQILRNISAPRMEASDDLTLLLEWMNGNLLPENRKNRIPRTPQLYLWGPPGIGKSRMISTLRTYLRVYDIPSMEDYYDMWDDAHYDLAILDEFKGQKTIQWLNRWLDGNPFTLRKKGSQIYKTFNVPTIIISNYALSESYNGCSAAQLAPLRDRLVSVCITTNLLLSFEGELTGEEINS
jgi:hypothetical protein